MSERDSVHQNNNTSRLFDEEAHNISKDSDDEHREIRAIEHDEANHHAAFVDDDSVCSNGNDFRAREDQARFHKEAELQVAALQQRKKKKVAGLPRIQEDENKENVERKTFFDSKEFHRSGKRQFREYGTARIIHTERNSEDLDSQTNICSDSESSVGNISSICTRSRDITPLSSPVRKKQRTKRHVSRHNNTIDGSYDVIPEEERDKLQEYAAELSRNTVSSIKKKIKTIKTNVKKCSDPDCYVLDLLMKHIERKSNKSKIKR